MNIKDCFYLGKIGKPKSFKGEVFFHFDNDYPELYEELEFMYLQIGKRLIKYPVEYISFKNNFTGIIKFENINDEDSANIIKNFEAYLPNDFLPELEEGEVFLHDIIGMKVIDSARGEIGTVDEINDMSAQRLLIINKGPHEIFIPYIDAFVVKMDPDKKEIHLNLPEGLIDINE